MLSCKFPRSLRQKIIIIILKINVEADTSLHNAAHTSLVVCVYLASSQLAASFCLLGWDLVEGRVDHVHESSGTLHLLLFYCGVAVPAAVVLVMLLALLFFVACVKLRLECNQH